MEAAAESRGTAENRHRGWGGRRPGAGRRPRDLDKWIAARGLKPATAAEILERGDERAIWYRLLHSPDDGIVLRAVTYLTDRRDGRAAQQINVTSQSLTITADDVAKARAIVRELAGDRVLALPAPILEARV